MIRAVAHSDARQICDIYNYYIATSIATFEEKPVSTEEMVSRIEAYSRFPWIVYERNAQILGYAYATGWKARTAYRHTAEISVYLKNGQSGKGIGTILYRELISRLKIMNFHAVIGGISLPNDPSVALHEKLGFRKIGHFREVGFKFGQWVDVGYWQLLL